MKIPLCEISCLCNFLSMICLSMKCLSMKCLLMKCLLMKYLSMKCLSLKCLGHALSFRTIHRAELVDRTLEQYFKFFFILQLHFLHSLQQGFQFFTLKISIFSSGFLQVSSSDIWFFIKNCPLTFFKI